MQKTMINLGEFANTAEFAKELHKYEYMKELIALDERYGVAHVDDIGVMFQDGSIFAILDPNTPNQRPVAYADLSMYKNYTNPNPNLRRW